MSTTPLFRWSSGEYIGFYHQGSIYDRECFYLGWVEPNTSAWRTNGHFWGQLVEGCYLMRFDAYPEPAALVPRIPPIAPMPPAEPAARPGRAAVPGWSEAL
jgi:hypothetical protein